MSRINAPVVPPSIYYSKSYGDLRVTNIIVPEYLVNSVSAPIINSVSYKNVNLEIKNGNINNSGTINDIVLQLHGNGHGFNGVDPLPEANINEINSLSETINNSGTSNNFIRSDHVHAHGNLGGGLLHSVVSYSDDGFMSASDKIKLNNISSDFNPLPISTSSTAGFNNSFSRSDHVHYHGIQTLGTLHNVATESVSGFMEPTDLLKTQEITWYSNPGIFSINNLVFQVNNQPLGIIYGSFPQFINNDVDTKLTTYWTNVEYINEMTYNSGTITIIREGYYNIIANPHISGNTNGYRKGFIQINNIKTGISVLNYSTDSNISPTLSLQCIEYLLAGDQISVYVYHTAGNNVSMADTITQFCVCKIC